MSEFKGYNTYKELLSLIDRSGKKYNLRLIDEAYNVAKEAHKNQKRVSGIPYILHPVSVAYILVERCNNRVNIHAELNKYVSN